MIFRESPLDDGFRGREFDRNTCKNLMKLLGRRPGLPGKVTSSYIVPLDPAQSAGLAGHVPAKRSVRPPESWRTILSFAKGNSCHVFVAGSMGSDRDPTISDQRIPPSLPTGRYKIFSGISVEFWRVRFLIEGLFP